MVALISKAERRLVLADLYLDEGARGRARLQLERALEDLELIPSSATSFEHARLLALVQAALAPMLAERGELERARELATAATQFFTRWPDSYRARIAELQSPSFDRQP